jgi:23S rRNA (adenine2503-C2)-methyltransferase
MKIIHENGDDNLAKVYVGELSDGSQIEFVESVQPPLPIEKKWVLIVSTLKGCPVKCPICDAGGNYRGKLSKDEILDQIDFLIKKRFPTADVKIPKLKIQFARMGDPALNENVLDVLSTLPEIYYNIPGLLPSISTIAPYGKDNFFSKLIKIKEKFYNKGNFQMQFSLHTTSKEKRRELIPCKTWGFSEMAKFGDNFVKKNDKKITLNFAACEGYPLEASELLNYFSPEKFIIKLTPVNPTYSSEKSKLKGLIDPENPVKNNIIVKQFSNAGYDTILSIGELKENIIGSNCGMYISKLANT